MIGVTAAPKQKVSLTISADLLALVDRDARARGDTRSGVVEAWLRRAASASVEQEIEEATAAYYRSLRPEERSEEEQLSRGLSRAARRVAHDESDSARRPRAKRARP